MAVCLLLTVGCAAKGGFSLGGQAGPASSSSSPSAPAGSAPAGGRSVDDVLEASRAKPVKDFDPDAFYAITTTVNGKQLALTFIPPENLERGESVTNNASKSKVELRPVANDPTQHWQFHLETIDPGHSYTIYSKVSDHKEQLTGTLVLSNPDNRFVPTDAYRAKHNRLTVGMSLNETRGYWHVVGVAGGKFQIRSLIGHADRLNKPDERERGEKWNEERVLEVTEEGGVVRVGHGPVTSSPTQAWTMTKVGY